MSPRALALAATVGLASIVATAEPVTTMDTRAQTNTPPAHEFVSFGLGCFWCGEAVFQRVEGVSHVTSGYQGGRTPNPTYEQVCTGVTGHAEVIRIEYDPAKVTFDELLDIFWQAHDPTQPNGQGNDHGPQYRSVIFCYSDAQKAAAEASRIKAQASGKFSRPIVTEILRAPQFHAAESYHQNYFNDNRTQPYCRMVISPKLKKLHMQE